MTTNDKVESEKAVSAAELAYDGIMDLVLNGELRPGERTSVNLLASRLDLGRTPVKEAITRLQTEGLLSIAGRSGTMVKRIERAQTEQLFAMRRALEEFAAEHAVVNATEADIRRIKGCLDDLARSNSTPEFVRANVEFHSQIVAAAGNAFLVRFYGQLQLQLQIVTYLLKRGFDRNAADQRQREHVGIFDALANRDAAVLKERLNAHALVSERAILKTLLDDEDRQRSRGVSKKSAEFA